MLLHSTNTHRVSSYDIIFAQVYKYRKNMEEENKNEAICLIDYQVYKWHRK